MKSQLVALLGAEAIATINTFAQLAAFLVGAVGYYQSRLPGLLARGLPTLSAASKLVFIGRRPGGFEARIGRGAGAGSPDSPAALYVALASVALLALLASSHGPLYWAAYPFLQLYHAIAVWRHLQVGWPAFLVPLKSVGLILWAIISLLLLYVVGFGSLFKSTILGLDRLARWLSPQRLRALLFAAFVLSAGTALITSVDL